VYGVKYSSMSSPNEVDCGIGMYVPITDESADEFQRELADLTGEMAGECFE